ncbi:MAG: hypothetical protein JO189_06650 [Deltaproteobacteria bacterium]|nr:hypothetical protein [Deltaproteobacteria bacterium]
MFFQGYCSGFRAFPDEEGTEIFGGRPRKLKPLKVAEIVRAIKADEKTPAELALIEDVHVKTIHRLLAREQSS